MTHSHVRHQELFRRRPWLKLSLHAISRKGRHMRSRGTGVISVWPEWRDGQMQVGGIYVASSWNDHAFKPPTLNEGLRILLSILIWRHPNHTHFTDVENEATVSPRVTHLDLVTTALCFLREMEVPWVDSSEGFYWFCSLIHCFPCQWPSESMLPVPFSSSKWIVKWL